MGATVGAVLLLLAATTPVVQRDAVFDVGGQNVHVRIIGDRGPASVFEAGLGEDMSTWHSLVDPVAGFARVILYDRAGLGESVPLARRDRPITAHEVVDRLQALLPKAGVPPPYILVGHSIGGLYVQMFARCYPGEVAGVVLIDAASPFAPPELKTRARLTPGSAADLEEAGVPASNAEVLRAGPFPAVPLAVIAATDHGPYFRRWEKTLMALQRQLATLSPQGRLIVAEGSGHFVQLERPALVVRVIRNVVAETGH